MPRTKKGDKRCLDSLVAPRTQVGWGGGGEQVMSDVGMHWSHLEQKDGGQDELRPVGTHGYA